MSNEKINISDLECLLVDLLCKYKNRSPSQSWSSLSEYINLVTKHSIDRERLKGIGEGSKSEKSARFSIADLKAFYEIFDEEDRKILAPLFVPRPRLLSIFDRETKLGVFLAALPLNDDVSNSFFINRYHVRAFEELLDSSVLEHLKVKFIDVILREDPWKISEFDWCKILSGDEKRIHLTISHPYLNISAEYLLAKIFNQESFNPDYTKTLPLRMYFPKVDKRGLPNSCLDMTEDMLIKQCPQVTTTNNRIFVIGNHPYILDRREDLTEKNDKTTSYGLLISRYIKCNSSNENHILHVSILGGYASDNLAIAHRAFSCSRQIPAKLPKPNKFKEPHILIIIFKNTLGLLPQKIKDRRKIENIRIVECQLWYFTNDVWRIKETSISDDKNHQYINKLKPNEEEITLDLY